MALASLTYLRDGLIKETSTVKGSLPMASVGIVRLQEVINIKEVEIEVHNKATKHSIKEKEVLEEILVLIAIDYEKNTSHNNKEMKDKIRELNSKLKQLQKESDLTKK